MSSAQPVAEHAWSVENVLTLLLATALPVTFASGFTHYEVLKNTVLMIGGALLLLLWTARAVRGQTLRLRGVLALLPVLALAVVAATSAIWAPNPTLALLDSARWFALLGVLLATLDPLDRPLPFGHLAAAVSGGVGAAAVLGALQIFGVEIDPMAPSVTADGFRASFDDQTTAALTIAAMLPLAAVGAFAASGPGRILAGLGLAAGSVYLGLVSDVGAFIALGVGLSAAAAIIAIGHGPHGLIPAIGPGLAIVGAALVIVAAAALAPTPEPSSLPPELAGTKLERGSYVVDEVDWARTTPPQGAVGHEYAVSTGLNAFKAKPLAGLGAGNYDVGAMGWPDHTHPFYQASDAGRPTFRSAHNAWVELAAELGVIGFGCLATFLLVVGAALFQAMRKSARDPEDGQATPLLHLLGATASLITLLIGFTSSDLLGTATAAFLLVATAGYVLRESFILLEDRALARPWVLSRETSGHQALERFILAGLLPLAASIGALYLSAAFAVSDYYEARGDVWLRHGNLDNAATAYHEALAANPANDLAAFQLAHVLLVGDDLDAIEKATDRALQLRPFDPRLYTCRGNLQARIALKRGKDRLIQQNQQPRTGPDGKPLPPGSAPGGPTDGPPGGAPNISAEALLGNLDKTAIAQAESSFNHALELHPRYTRALRGLANLYVSLKDLDKAIATYLRALDKESPDDRRGISELHVRIGQLYRLDEKWALAKEHLEKALTVFPEHPGRKSLGMDLEEIDAHLSGKAPPQRGHDHGGHGHGPGPELPFDVNEMRKKRQEQELDVPLADPPRSAPPASAPAPGSAPPAP